MASHQSLSVDRMLKELQTKGVVECNSPKNRARLFKLLDQEKIKVKKTIIGYTVGKKDICRWSGSRQIGWDLGRIANWIHNKRLLKTDLQEACKITESFKFEDVESIFDDGLTREQIKDVIEKKWGENLEWIKWTPFDSLHIRKTIVRIEVIQP